MSQNIIPLLYQRVNLHGSISQEITAANLTATSSEKFKYEWEGSNVFLTPVERASYPQPCHQLNHTNRFHSQRFHHEHHDVNCRRFQGQIQDRAVIILWVSHAANSLVSEYRLWSWWFLQQIPCQAPTLNMKGKGDENLCILYFDTVEAPQ